MQHGYEQHFIMQTVMRCHILLLRVILTATTFSFGMWFSSLGQGM